MGRISIADIMTRISSTVNQDATNPPTAGGTEWTLWLSFINRAIQEWAETTDWEPLVKFYYPAIQGMSQATISLPNDFKRLANLPRLYGQTTGTWDNGQSYPEVMREEVDLYPATDKFVFITGDTNNGFILTWNPGTLASGASLVIPYFSIPTSLASPAQIPLVPDSEFLIDRVVSYIFEARSDSRFQEVEAKARERLLQMVENHNIGKYSSFAGPTPVHNTTRLQGFRFGRD